MEADRTVVIGIDGAHFELIQPWVDAGDLPNIARICDSGVTGDLHSVLPPVTSPNWKAYATGKNPGKIGIFWWENVDVENERVYYPSERKHHNTELWEVLSRESTVGVLGVPTTYPPKEVNGFLVSGAPDAENRGFAYPESVEEQLREDGYRVRKQRRLSGDTEAASEEILELIDSRFETAKRLADEFDVSFLQITTFYINSLHHFLWDHDITHEAWKRIDAHVGDVVEPSDNVVLMSDHGSNEIETVFHVNTWLEQNGYLETDLGTAKLLYRLGITTRRLERLAGLLGVKELARRVAPDRIKGMLADEHGDVNQEGKTSNVDWEESQAVASGQGPVYVLDPTVEDEIRQQLQDLEGPNGPIATDVYRGAELYDGPYVDEGPQLVIDQAENVHISGGIGRGAVFSPPEEGWAGENKKQGLFAASGPDFTNGDCGSLSILDLAPTILHLFGRPVPESMDGDVATEIFAEESKAATNEVRRTAIDDRQEEIARIRSAARRLYER